MENNRSIIGSVNKALTLLDRILDEGRLSVHQAAQMLDIDRSSAYRLLETLAAEDYVYKDDDSIYYEPGIRMDFYRAVRPDNGATYAVSKPDVLELQRATGMTAHMCVLAKSAMYFIGQESGEGMVRIVMKNEEQLHCTASGKSVLAAWPEKYRDKLIDSLEFASFTPNTITNRQDLIRQLEEVRRKGYARDNCELHEDVYCVAAPVYLRRGWPMYSLGVSSTRPIGEECALIVLEASRTLSRHLQDAFGTEGGKT